MAQGVPRDHVYDQIFYVLATLLVAGFICNALIRPVRAKWHIEEEDGINLAVSGKTLGSKGAYGIGRGGPDAKAFIAWALVGLPLAWGVWKTLENAAKIFQSPAEAGHGSRLGYGFVSAGELAPPDPADCASSNANSLLFA